MKHASALIFTLALTVASAAFAATMETMEGIDMKPATQAGQSKQDPKPVGAEVPEVYPDTGKQGHAQAWGHPQPRHGGHDDDIRRQGQGLAQELQGGRQGDGGL